MKHLRCPNTWWGWAFHLERTLIALKKLSKGFLANPVEAGSGSAKKTAKSSGRRTRSLASANAMARAERAAEDTEARRTPLTRAQLAQKKRNEQWTEYLDRQLTRVLDLALDDKPYNPANPALRTGKGTPSFKVPRVIDPTINSVDGLLLALVRLHPRGTPLADVRAAARWRDLVALAKRGHAHVVQVDGSGVNEWTAKATVSGIRRAAALGTMAPYVRKMPGPQKRVHEFADDEENETALALAKETVIAFETWSSSRRVAP